MVQRSIVAAKEKLNNSSISIKMYISSNGNLNPEIYSGDFCAIPPFGTNDTPFPHAFGVRLREDKVHYKDNENKLKRGDLVVSKGHIAIIHSEKWGVSKYSNTLNTKYDVIHAYGVPNYNEGIKGKLPVFSRKVTVTGNNAVAPQGLGRVKLWD